MALNDKLINYEDISTFHSNLINDSSVSVKSTWSSSKISSELADAVDAIYNLIYTLHPDADYLNFSANLPNTKVRLVLYSDFEAEPSTPIDIDYSFDRKNWTHYTVGNNITIPTDGKVYLRGNNDYFSVYDYEDYDDILYYHYFEFENESENTLNVEAHGNINSLLSKTNWNEITTLAEYCYYYMFYDCTALTEAPALPTTSLTDYCYSSMFYGCTSLTEAPTLPATSLAGSCYSSMFEGCTALTEAPTLPATSLTEGCYSNMFSGCTSLTEAPALPATSLANSCYSNMFYDCTSLTEAPALPATSLAGSCYSSMFYGCTSLTEAPTLPATSLAGNCYSGMFSGCRNLSYINCQATTNITTTNCSYWVNGVSNSGTFIKDANATWTTGNSGIPSGWTVQDYVAPSA
jgi:hypothetical protein